MTELWVREFAWRLTSVMESHGYADAYVAELLESPVERVTALRTAAETPTHDDIERLADGLVVRAEWLRGDD